MKVIIGADIVPTQSNCDFFSNGITDRIIDENLKNELERFDFRIFNLEVPLTDEETPIEKCGPNLIAATSCINGIKKLGVDLFTLANNHIMDHDVQGLESTISVLKQNGIDYVGAGNNIEEAQKPYVIEKDGKKVGIYACAEHEFSIAERNYPGANPFDPRESLDHIAALKRQCDYVVVLYHGGKEYYRFPSPTLQKACRKMCDKGADLVICQHSHCIGCEEKYNNSTIVYGQGNFIFDAKSDEFWDSALLVQVDFTDKMNIVYIPLEKESGIVRISSNEDILKAFVTRSEQIENEEFVIKTYDEYADSVYRAYMQNIYGANILFRALNKLCKHKLHRPIWKRHKYALINFIECEAHRELLITALKNSK